MTLKAIVLHHLEYTFEKEAWQPSLLMAIDGLTSREAQRKPASERHSTWQIVRHLTHWKRATLGAWDGSQPLYDAATGPTEAAREAGRTDWAEARGDDAAWRADREALLAVSEEIRKRVEAMPEAAFLEPFPGEDMPAVLRLLRMATHDIYHAGQIRYLRALQGA